MIGLSLTEKGADSLRKKLDLEAKGVEYTRIKFIVKLKTEKAFKIQQNLIFGDYEIIIKEYDGNSNYNVLCEVICEKLKGREENIILNEVIEKIEKIFTLLDSPFEILNEKETYYFYKEIDEWLIKVDLNMSMSILELHHKFPHEILNLIKQLDDLSKSNSKKFSTLLEMIDIYKFGLNYFNDFKRDSFLYFYLILERIADDLPSNLTVINKVDDLVFKELTKFSLKSAQKNKMYLLHIFMERSFLIENVMDLAETRNKLAHGKQNIDFNKLSFCREFSFKCLKKYIELNA